MDGTELESSLKSFWKAFKAGDLEKCESIYSGCSEDGSFEGLVLRLNACIALEKEETPEVAGSLILEFADPETSALNEDGIEAFVDQIMECFSRLADLGRAVPLVFFYDIDLDIEKDLDFLAAFRHEDKVFCSLRRRLEKKMTDQKSPDKVNAYLGFIAGTLTGTFLEYGVSGIFSDLVTFKLHVEPIVARKSMAGRTGYAELLLFFARDMADFFSDLQAEGESEGQMPVFVGEMSLDECFDLIGDLSVYPNSLGKDEVAERTAALKKQMREHIEFVDTKQSFQGQDLPDMDFKDILSQIGSGSMGREDDAEEEDSDNNEGPSTPDEAMSAFKELVKADCYQEAYDVFNSSLDRMPQLLDRMDEAIDVIADDIAYKYIHSLGTPTYGHPDELASSYPDGSVEFFRKHGARLMSHLGECRSADAASDLPDGFAMYSRFIFDCYDLEGIGVLFREVADAYGKASEAMKKNRRRFGGSTDWYSRICDHSRKVYEGMTKVLEEEMEDDMLAVPPLVAGHDFDDAFYHWFMQRAMHLNSGDKWDKAATKMMCGTIRSLIHDE